MNPDFLDFEHPIAELEAKINELRRFKDDDSELNIGEEVARLEEKCLNLTETIFSKLKPWQISQLARHPLRPYTRDYIEMSFTDFQELHGDRAFADDPAIMGGIALFKGHPVMVIGHQKGRGTKEKVRHNFGMPRPEGYRKARRLIKLAERYRLPVLSFIDTPGAYPGMDAEERGVNEAIAENMAMMSLMTALAVASTPAPGP
jgi:acetyl-CoA carboxylase carboxyl transferase subunit alpha